MISYRKDIQGIRCLAVLLVFFAHADIDWLTGGFIGVDVFFVISGYVISALLLKTKESSAGIQLMSFYGRRMLRLFPAMLIMVLSSLLFSLYVIPPEAQKPSLAAAPFAMAYLSNWYFLFQELNYFSPINQGGLFLHTWSLAVEEQFYLIWPFILLWLIKPSKNCRAVKVLPKAIMVIMISFFLLIMVSKSSDMYGFYLMPTRIWQFMLGSLIAYQHVQIRKSKIDINMNLSGQLGSLLGLTLIITAAMIIDDYDPYPGWRVLWPSLGAAMLLYFYSPSSSTWVSKALSVRPMVWMGNLSYSFYLWHWVVLLFISRLQFFIPWMNVWFGFFCTLFFALISYYCIEKPIRNNQKFINRPKLVLSIVIVIMVLVYFFTFALKGLVQSYGKDSELKKLADIQQDAPIIYQYDCDTWYHSAEVSTCWFGEGKSGRKLVLFGDSIVAQWFPLIAEVYPSEDWHIIVITKSACPMVDESYYYSRIKSKFTICEKWRENAIAYIQRLQADVLVIGSSSLYPFTSKQWRKGSRSLLERLIPYVKKTKILAATPELSFNAYSCLSQAYWLSKFIKSVNKEQCFESMKNSEVWEIFSVIAESYDQVDFLNFNSVICPGGVCSAIQNGFYTFRDNRHLTATYVSSLVTQLKDYFDVTAVSFDGK